MDSIKDDIKELIASLNTTWTTDKDIDGLEKYFHPNAIALVSKGRRKISGKEACVAHWKACSENEIHSWKTDDPEVHVYGDGMFATAAYEFEIVLTSEGEQKTSINRDIFSFVFEDNHWQIVAAVV